MSNDSSDTPLARGFSMPAEWETHAATWLSWPNERGATFPGEELPPILPHFHRLATALAEAGEKVCINVSDEAEAAAIESALTPEIFSSVTLQAVPTNEPWVRDHGPTVLRRNSDGARLAVCWKYNSWGEKYPPWVLDAAANQQMAQLAGVEIFDRRDLVIEGGSLESNGAGILMVSESSVVNDNRNPGKSRNELARELCESTGSKEVLWVNADVEGDDTDGHVDCFARFAPGNRLVVLDPSPAQQSRYATLAANARHLRAVADERGWEFIGLPIPEPVVVKGMILPATYANFYIANQAVLVATFDDPCDDIAAARIASAFSDRPVVQVPARELIWGQGGFHCLTQQLPA